MQINLIKLIKDVLPTFNRSNKFVQIIFVLIAEARTSFNEFISQVPDWKYKAKANASVLSIQNTIKRELNVDAVITELDGKPVDFLVSVTGFVDFSAVKNLIDKYKLAGRSYVFETGAVTYFCSFINHVCVLDLIDNVITLSTDPGTGDLAATAATAVTSDVIIKVRRWAEGYDGDYVNAVIRTGTSIADFDQQTQPAPYNQLVAVSPADDLNFRYIIDNTILNG